MRMFNRRHLLLSVSAIALTTATPLPVAALAPHAGLGVSAEVFDKLVAIEEALDAAEFYSMFVGARRPARLFGLHETVTDGTGPLRDRLHELVIDRGIRNMTSRVDSLVTLQRALDERYRRYEPARWITLLATEINGQSAWCLMWSGDDADLRAVANHFALTNC